MHDNTFGLIANMGHKIVQNNANPNAIFLIIIEIYHLNDL